MAFTKGKMDTQIQQENEPLQGLSAIFWHAKDFATAHEVAGRSLRNSTGGHMMASDALTNGPMFLRSDRF